MDELGVRLKAIEGLRVKPYWADSITPPAAIVLLPDRIDFDETYDRGSDSMEIPVWVLVGKASDRASRDAIARYASGSGEHSIKARLEASGYTSCDDVTVRSCEFLGENVSGVDYLVAAFQLTITGSGE